MNDLFDFLQEKILPSLPESRTDEVIHFEMCCRVVERYNKAKKVNEDFAEEHGLGKAEEAPKVEEPKGDSDVGGEKKSEGSFEVTDELVASIAQELDISFEEEGINKEEFKKGLTVEQEHIDVTQNDPNITGQIALAHLQEIPDYYTRLAKMEADYKAEKEGATKDEEIPSKDEAEPAEPKKDEETVKEAKVHEALTDKGIATVQSWIDTFGARKAANKIIDSVLNKMVGMGSSDLPDTTTFANGLDDLETLLKEGSFQDAYSEAKVIATEMLAEEGFDAEGGANEAKVKVDELNIADMGAVKGEMEQMKSKTPFKPMSRKEQKGAMKKSDDCHCIVRHARSPAEREAVKNSLAYFRKIGDSIGISMAMAQLSGCPCDEAIGAFDQSGSIWGSHPPRRTLVAEKPKVCPKCGLNPNDTQSEDQQKWEADYVKEHGVCSACDQEKNEAKETT